MKYPGLATSLKHQLSEAEWALVGIDIITVDKLSWHQNDKACQLLEEAAKKAIENDYYRAAARVLYYYDKFFAESEL